MTARRAPYLPKKCSLSWQSDIKSEMAVRLLLCRTRNEFQARSHVFFSIDRN